ncbi:alanine aminotransferase 2-like [Pempheris klunzingeri]|uniref:alanine aminotransferase 2-like n=1 Tax=Pempheris klunzingeri TaxID=3127111 RepID=UPI003980AA85
MRSSVQDVNPRVRGIREPTGLQSLAARITEEISQGAKKPFKTVIDVSSADPHRAGMAPSSFVRQVLAVCLYPELLKEKSFPLDVRQRAQKLLGACGGGSVGSYSITSRGIPHVQKSVAEFIARRDGGVSSNPEEIIFSSGSQKTLTLVLHLMASGEGATQTGVLTPTPCPHTLPTLLDVSGVTVVPYQLMEDRGWAVDLDELHRALRTARGRCEPRAIYISNPGNPTGHVQDRKTIEEVIRFAAAEGLVLLAEEVNQDSVYGQDKEFVSYKKVLFEMGAKYSETVELISFNSISSACMGECGLRGGYMEVINMDLAVSKYLRNMQATSSPPVLPQLALEVMVNPPTPGQRSYKTYAQEILHTRTTLSQNAQRACEFLNNLPGMKCQPAMAGVFLYPRLHLPPQMIEEATVVGVEADVFYCQRLLEEEGVCLGAGCENGQEDQNHHVRLCVLAPPATLEEVLARLRSFHLRLLDRFP